MLDIIAAILVAAFPFIWALLTAHLCRNGERGNFYMYWYLGLTGTIALYVTLAITLACFAGAYAILR